MATIEENIVKLTVSDPADEGDVVTPWNVESQSDGGIDYDKLIGKKIILCSF